MKEYKEVLDYVDELAEGSKNEDIPITNVVHHFYNPALSPNIGGLKYDEILFDSSLVTAIPVWKEAIKFYGTNNKSGAYEKLGHVVHLIAQDTAQPAHVHNDPHLPSVLRGDASPYENYVEALAGGGGSTLPSFYGAEVRTGRSLLEFADQVAIPTYKLSVFHQTSERWVYDYEEFYDPGIVDPLFDYDELDYHVYGAVMMEIRVGSKVHRATRWPADPMSPITLDDHFKISGKTRDLIWDPGINGDGGFFNSFGNDFWPTDIPSSYQDEEGSCTNIGVEVIDGYCGYIYFDQADEVTVDEAGTTLNQYFFENTLPRSIDFTAGLLKYFHDIANEPPYLKGVILGNASGTVYESIVETGANPEIRTRSITPSQPLQFDTEYNVRLTFSEPVINPSYRIGSLVVSGLRDVSQGVVWEGKLTTPRPRPKNPKAPICGSPQFEDTQATDGHTHLGLPNVSGFVSGAYIDKDPTTVARRDSTEISIESTVYPWLGYETSSTSENNPSFRFACPNDATPPITSSSFKADSGLVTLTVGDVDNSGTVTGGLSTFYSASSAAGPFSLYAGPFRPPEASSDVFYYSVDFTGNREPVKTLSVTPITIPMVLKDVLRGDRTPVFAGGTEYFSVYGNGQFTWLYLISQDNKFTHNYDGAEAAGPLLISHTFNGSVLAPYEVHVTYKKTDDTLHRKTLFLPSFTTSNGRKMYFYLGEQGSSYYGDLEHDGLNQESDELLSSTEALKPAHLARRTLLPNPITDLAAVFVATQTVRLCWTPSKGLGPTQNYKIQIATDPMQTFHDDMFTLLQSPALGADERMCALAGGLAIGTTYYAAVLSSNEGGKWVVNCNIASASRSLSGFSK